MIHLNFKKRLIILANIFFGIIILFHIYSINKIGKFNASLALNLDEIYEKYYFDKNILNATINNLAYRVILIPQFTASKWYLSKEEIFENKDIYLKYLYKTKDNQKLSNKIGIHYFNKMRPEKWTKSINANASFDADAYVRFGFLGILFFIITLNTTRYLLFKMYSSKDNKFYFQIYILFTFGHFTLVSASFQSLLISQGYIILGLFIIKNYFNKFNLIR